MSALITDNWDPTSGVVTPTVPMFTVSAGGTYPTVQSAVTAAVAAGGTSRVSILLSPGTYREVVCVPIGAPPITLYGSAADPSLTTIVYDNFSGKATDATTPTNACTGTSTGTYGTAGSATFAAFAKGFQAKNVTFANDVTSAMLGATVGTQGVALMTQADQIVLENVRVVGHQDSMYLESPNADTVVRVYVKSSFIAGDVDYVFGGATSVLDGCTIQFVSDRKTSGQVLAPDTDARNPYGMLVVNGTFTADSTSVTGIGLGRAWDHNCSKPVAGTMQYATNCVGPNPNGAYPNGQATIRNSMLGPHIDVSSAPWKAAATSARPFASNPVANCEGTAVTCPANRLYEFQDTP